MLAQRFVGKTKYAARFYLNPAETNHLPAMSGKRRHLISQGGVNPPTSSQSAECSVYNLASWFELGRPVNLSGIGGLDRHRPSGRVFFATRKRFIAKPVQQ
jgi:hypothetical protein